MTQQLQGKHYIARRRLSDGDNNTIADVGETCERVQAAKSGGTVSDALARLLASGKIALAPPAVPVKPPKPQPKPPAPVTDRGGA